MFSEKYSNLSEPSALSQKFVEQMPWDLAAVHSAQKGRHILALARGAAGLLTRASRPALNSGLLTWRKNLCDRQSLGATQHES
jgi:hypothetical protein